MSRNDIAGLLDRYLDGTALPDEVERVETWLNDYQDPAGEWQLMDKNSREQWLAHLFKEIEPDADVIDTKVVVMQPKRKIWRSMVAAAAAILVFFMIYYLWPANQGNTNTPQLTALNVPAGQKTQVTLADGSKIWINSASQLKYPKVFAGKTREVYLTGEAYFDIQHDATKPFIIHTGKVITTVLGTAFDIKQDMHLHTVVVTVTRGKVSVANGSHGLGVITPNQQISFNEVSHQHSQNNVNAEQVIAWQEDYIHFNDITFADAVAQLQKRFNVKISFTNENVKKCRFTGSALKEEKLDKILKVICAFNNATYQTKENGNIVIDGPGCN